MEQWVLYTRRLVHHPTSFQQSFDPVEEEENKENLFQDPQESYWTPSKDYHMAEAPIDDNENEVTQFLREIKKEKWIYKFLENDITDLQTLRELKPDEWKLLELPIGARNAIEREVKDRMLTVAPDSPQKSKFIGHRSSSFKSHPPRFIQLLNSDHPLQYISSQCCSI
jgi:hypothetical protein